MCAAARATDAFVNYLTRIETRIDKAAAAATKRLADISPSAEQPHSPKAATANDGTASEEQVVAVVETVPIEVQQDREMRKALGPVARALLRPGVGGSNVQKPRAPTMAIKDEHVDVFCRFVFLPAFIVTLVVYAARLPPAPILSPMLAGACNVE